MTNSLTALSSERLRDGERLCRGVTRAQRLLRCRAARLREWLADDERNDRERSSAEGADEDRQMANRTAEKCGMIL